ncbi:hypothetical protein AX16_004341 [Volvariella volvacea WC 439]|nr:hypothetical protein AX16_004341 [Volvariella volvacea WC 439]
MLPRSLNGSSFDLFDASCYTPPLLAEGRDNTPSPLATFSVSVEGLATINDSAPEKIFVNHDPTIIEWKAKAGDLWSGQIIITDNYSRVEGMLETEAGEYIHVIGHRRADVQAEQASNSPPSYYAAVGATEKREIARGNAKTATKKPSSVETDCYGTERRQLDKEGNPIGDWSMWSNIYIGAESPFGVPITVFYVQTIGNRVDVSDTTLTVKEDGKMCYRRTTRTDYVDEYFTFDISVTGMGEESTFSGTWTDADDRKEEEVKYEWRGTFSMSAIIPRDAAPPPVLDDAGNSLAKLLSITSKMTQLVSRTLPNSGKTITEQRQIDIAQNEGDRIYGQILLHAIPDEYRTKMFPDLPTLDEEAKAIMTANHTFFSHAGTVTLLQQWAQSGNVPKEISSRIRTDRLKCFWEICIGAPCKEEYDPVKEYGWDHTEHAELIRDLRTQFLQATISCYRLGYTRQVSEFRAYLDRADFWYPKLATWAATQGVRAVQQEAATFVTKARDRIMEYHTQLVLLRGAMGDASLDPGVLEPDEAIEGMGEALQFEALKAIQWNDATKQHFTEILDYLNLPEQELVKKHGNLAKVFSEFKQSQLESGVVDTSYMALKLFDRLHQIFPRLGAWELSQKLSWNLQWKVIPRQKAHSLNTGLISELQLQNVGNAEKVVKWFNAYVRSIMAVSCAAAFISLTTGDRFTKVEKVVLWGSAATTIGVHLAPAARWLGKWLNAKLPEKAQAYLAGVRNNEQLAQWATRLGKLGKLLIGAFAFGLSLIFTVRAYKDLVECTKYGRKIDSILACGSFISMAVETAVLGVSVALHMAVEAGIMLVETVGGALGVCGVIGSVCILAGVVFATATLATWFFFPPKGPMEIFMDKYVAKRMMNLMKGR